MKNALALIVIYNHKYEKNIEIIERIYKERFSNIYHLIPFYEGDKQNVISVYECSYYFQGYVAQGFKQYFDCSYKHYFFVADDMILNPAINENNYTEIFQIDDSSGFIQELDPMPAPKWGPYNRFAVTYDPYRSGTEIKCEIPSVEEAKGIIGKLDINNGPYSIKQTYYYNNDRGIKSLIRQSLSYLYDKYVLRTNLHNSRYPFIRSYSDIFIVSAKNIRKFVHYCGVFAATDLWVELAIPTALALSGENIKVQSQLKFHGKALWTSADYKILDIFDRNLKNLLNNFPKDYIYLHPIKLSKWNSEI